MAAPVIVQSLTALRVLVDTAKTRAEFDSRNKQTLLALTHKVGDWVPVSGTDYVCVDSQNRVQIETLGADRTITLLHPLACAGGEMKAMKTDEDGYKAKLKTVSGVIHFNNVAATDEHHLVAAGDSVILWCDGVDYWVFK